VVGARRRKESGKVTEASFRARNTETVPTGTGAEGIPPELVRRLAELQPSAATPPTSVPELLAVLQALPPPGSPALCAPATTRHRVLSADDERFTNCALDALILAFLEAGTVRIVTVDPNLGKAIEVQVGADGSATCSQPDAVLSFGVARSGDGPIQAIGCPHINLFVDGHSYRTWADAHPEVTSVMFAFDDALAVARAMGANR
jgi:hypothetical protein